ncbi:Gfo/Idh/MocA family oxidoreductase [Lentzea sp. NBRC 102530]|uniref:Gfo/Idh/MocA family protein n=1 Tax=Lentzea sp. NBRC 102530 TaxID=3032201 RepID=UPI0024A55D43|nr:Gfo/Idh/MocA family oxidoreductase [Lentzea sp. NBRC 102530]GLY47741.1 oxidoreductase [Lentzea sp. NBRC 102530]
MNDTVLVGTGGYGLRHLRSLLELERSGRLRLVALVDVHVGEQATALLAEHQSAPARYADLGRALAAHQADSVVIATPPHTHFALARTAIRAGTAVYLEKPPVTLLQDLDALAALPAARRVEVGFQAAGATVGALHRAWDALGRPPVDDVVAHGALTRPDEYYRRSRWAGTWFLDGQAVLDGPLFNPLAHVVQAALLFAGQVERDWAPASVEAECFHARPIEGDDISALRVTPHRGPRVVAVGTTSTDVVVRPGVLVHTRNGTIRVTDGGERVVAYRGRARVPVPSAVPVASALERAVTDPGGPGDPVLSLRSTRNLVLTANAVAQAVGAPGTPPRQSTWDGQRVAGLGRLVAACARRAALFSEVAPEWAGSTRRIEVTEYRGLMHPELVAA